jgi:hypothetical protein
VSKFVVCAPLASLRHLHAAASHIRVDVETTKVLQSQGASDMTKTLVAVKNSPLQPPLNSIVAAAKTAHELDAGRRKAVKAKVSRYSPSFRSSDGQSPPITSFKQRHESLIQFVLRLGRLVAVQIRERGKK